MTFTILKYLCEEVERQKDRPITVCFLAVAWMAAMEERRAWQKLRPAQIEAWGKAVKPTHNAKGFRTGPIWIGDEEGAPHYAIMARLNALCEKVERKEWDADKAYYEFQRIHPFADGNGRTGKILYNYILDKLDDPQLPPNFFGPDAVP